MQPNIHPQKSIDEQLLREERFIAHNGMGKRKSAPSYFLFSPESFYSPMMLGRIVRSQTIVSRLPNLDLESFAPTNQFERHPHH
jgi:hypothetical protein